MARDTTDQTPIRSTKRELAEHTWLPAASRRMQFRIGTEHEKFVFFTADNSPVPYEGEREHLGASEAGMQQKMLGWEPIDRCRQHHRPRCRPRWRRARSRWSRAASSSSPARRWKTSTRPAASSNQHLADVCASRRAASASGFLGIGGSPKWTLAETPRMPKSRYEIMTRYMPKVGTQGLDMMYRTCTIQVNLDFSSEEADMRRKMQVSLKLQPLATALFASSPFTEGKPNGFQSWRGEIWRDTDNPLRACSPFAFDEGIRLRALCRSGRSTCRCTSSSATVAITTCTHVTFRQFMAGALKDEIAGLACPPWATGPTISRRSSPRCG
jgi:glutamate--cysteine ligase